MTNYHVRFLIDLNSLLIWNFFQIFSYYIYNKVIKEKWGQYFANDHFCTPLCSKRKSNSVIKIFLEQKFANSSVINLIPNTWFNERNAIKKVRVDLVNWYCQYFAYMTLIIQHFQKMGKKYGIFWCLIFQKYVAMYFPPNDLPSSYSIAVQP